MFGLLPAGHDTAVRLLHVWLNGESLFKCEDPEPPKRWVLPIVVDGGMKTQKLEFRVDPSRDVPR